jgi:predicted CDP-diglyceride synthetase/phosphatidate cytidylyltransferase
MPKIRAKEPNPMIKNLNVRMYLWWTMTAIIWIAFGDAAVIVLFFHLYPHLF